jgi:hypothetical protein
MCGFSVYRVYSYTCTPYIRERAATASARARVPAAARPRVPRASVARRGVWAVARRCVYGFTRRERRRVRDAFTGVWYATREECRRGQGALLLYCPLFSLIKYGRKNQNYKIRRRARVYKNTVFRAQPDRVSTLPEIFGSVATRVSSPRPVSSPRVPKTLHLSTTFAKTSGPPDLFCRLYLISTSGVCLSPRAPLAFPQKDYACKKTLLVVCACPLHRRPVGFSSKRTTLAKTYTAPP